MNRLTLRNLFYFSAIFLLLFGIASIGKALSSADVMFLVDESGSMAGEHSWLGSMITSMDSELVAAGITGNQYALVGFGGHVSGDVAHKHTVGGGDWGTAADLSTAAGGLFTSGGFEDGWAAIDFGLNNYSFRSGVAHNLILITDEDRDNSDSSLNYSGILSALNGNNALLNVVVDANFLDGAGSTSLGIDSDSNAYQEDGSGGYTTSTGGYTNSAYGNTETAYIDLALATGAAAWDLNQLRAGGDTAVSFTDAFVDIKVQEIEEEIIPEPTTIFLMGFGLLGLFGIAIRQRRKNK